MATCRPARAARKARGVILAPNKNGAAGGLLLEMALKTERCVTLPQHPRIDGTMELMANQAAFARGLMLEDERPALHGVALEAQIGRASCRERVYVLV